jgi:hypothetical protein
MASRAASRCRSLTRIVDLLVGGRQPSHTTFRMARSGRSGRPGCSNQRDGDDADGWIALAVSNESGAIIPTDRPGDWDGKLLDKAEVAAGRTVALQSDNRPIRFSRTRTGLYRSSEIGVRRNSAVDGMPTAADYALGQGSHRRG